MGLLKLIQLTKEYRIDWLAMMKLITKESRITLREPMTVEDLYALMSTRWNESLPGNFSLKKSLFHKYIEFDEYLMFKICVQVTSPIALGWPIKINKNKIVYVDPGSQKPKSLSKTQWTKIEAVGGYMEAVPLAIEHYRAVRHAILEVLHDRVAADVTT